MLKFMGILAAASVLAFAPTSAANAKSSDQGVKTSPEVCLANCRAGLKGNGTWSSLPKGYCRNECNAH